MRRLWNFINHFSRAAPRGKTPALVREDLKWWNKLLLVYNRVLFFDTSSRGTQSLYTDACLYCLGEIYFKGFKSWEQVDLNQVNAFRAMIHGKAFRPNREMSKNSDDPA